MKNMIKKTVLSLSMLMSAAAFAVGPGGGATGIYTASVTTLGNDGSGSYYYTFSVTGNTLAACESALDDAINNYANVWGWTYCELTSIDEFFELDVLTPAGVNGGNNGGVGHNGGVITQIAERAAQLASEYDLAGYQAELDRLDARYGIQEYKTKLVEIYREETRKTLRK